MDSDQGESTNVRRLVREPVPSIRNPSSKYVNITECREPENFSEAKANVEKESWMRDMQVEMKSLHEENRWV